MTKTSALLVLSILFATGSQAQDRHAIDSLWNVYQTHQKDTIGLLALDRLAIRYLLPFDQDSAVSILELLQLQSAKIGWRKGSFLYLKDMGAVENRRFNLRKALFYNWEAIKIAEQYGYAHGAVYGNLGGTYSRLQLYDSAITVLNKALEMARYAKDQRLECQVNLNLAAAFGNKGNALKAVDYNIKAANLADKYNQKDLLAPAYRSLAISFAESKDTARLLLYANKLIQHAEQYRNTSNLFLGYLSVANYWEIGENHHIALTYIDKATPLLPKIKTPFEIGQYWLQSANCYSALGNIEMANEAWRNYKNTAGMIEEVGGQINYYTGLGLVYARSNTHPDSVVYYYQKAIEIATHNQAYAGASRAYNLLAGYYATSASADFPKAYAAYVQYKIYEDSLLNADKIRDMTAAEVSFGFERKIVADSLQMFQLANRNLASEIRIREQTDQLFRNKTDAEKREIILQLLGRDNQIQSLSLHRKDDSLATQQLRLVLTQTQNASQVAALKTEQEADAARRNRIIGLLGALLVLGGGAFYIFRLRQQAANDRKVAEVEMRALRAQMNPHFLFNSMNAINSYIVRNDTAAASDYLSRFARVMRNILENSQHPTVTLEKEIELLTQYLEVEQKRIEQGFQFDIQVADEVDTFETRIPSMILQPFIENAIIHGIRPKKEGQGLLRIHISKPPGGHICCIIEDNGIGRSIKSANTNPSMGLKITADRLQLWHQHKVANPIQFTDLTAANGSPSGTRVVVLI